MYIPLGADILTVLTLPVARGVYKTCTLMFGKPKFRKNSNVLPCFTEFSKIQEATILKKKKKKILTLIYILVVHSVKDNYTHHS